MAAIGGCAGVAAEVLGGRVFRIGVVLGRMAADCVLTGQAGLFAGAVREEAGRLLAGPGGGIVAVRAAGGMCAGAAPAAGTASRSGLAAVRSGLPVV